MAKIKTKQSFGGVTVAHVSPPVGETVPKAMNVHLTFEEALKLHFGLGQLLGKLSTYNRSTRAGKQAAANLCIYPHKLRITLTEGKLKANKATPVAPAAKPAPDEKAPPQPVLAKPAQGTKDGETEAVR